MGILVRKQRGVIFTGLAKLGFTAFVVALSISLIDTIWAVYLYSFLGNDAYVGFLSAFLTLVSFFSFFLIIPMIERSNKSRIYANTLLLFFIAYVLFAINTNFYIVVVLALVITVLNTVRVTSFGIIINDKSAEKKLSRNEGVMYTFMNVAWVIGPLIAGLVSESHGIPIIFLLAAIFIFLAFVLFKIFQVKDSNIKRKVDTNIVKNFSDFFRNRNRVYAYILGGGVNFWWSLIYLFMPLFIISNGLHIKWVGYFLFAVALPLIFFQYSFGKFAGRIGFKKIFKIGFFIPAFFAVVCFFIVNPFIVLSLLVLASIGLAMLEANTEAYFFDLLKKKEELRFYGPYNTTIDVNHFIGRVLSATILLFLPFKFLFLFFGASMLVFFFISFRVKEIVESRRDGRRN